jgi:ribonucleoside-diphosphate reductase alpha chain
MNGKYVPSLLAAIGDVIERHMIAIGFLPTPGRRHDGDGDTRIVVNAGLRPLRQCPRCGQATLLHQEGCDVCASCGHSKCS